jgi:hypothetical protein
MPATRDDELAIAYPGAADMFSACPGPTRD